ncbi:MAG TPA: alpha/beta hydrolase [Steroidobacteraceae bacterium]
MSRPETPLDHVTPYDRLAWDEGVVERLLATGEQQRELVAYFGGQEYAVLAKLARKAQTAVVRDDAPRVYIVPGIMGSQLGRLRRAPLPNDILWLDPVDISIGQLALLRMPGEAQIVSLGVVLFTYLRLKLHLRIAGFAPLFHDYDWRLGVDELGRKLAERVRADQGRVMIVAHSMGGLVSRAALACDGMQKVERVVLLGTPNHGSFAPVQALRGVYAVVRKIARLASDGQSAESLAADVFSTFPSLYHLLPAPDVDAGFELFDVDAWPNSGPRPIVPLLQNARTLGERLASADERFINIVGAGQETVTRATRQRDQFVYTITRQGDGTVPRAFAELPGARTYYTQVAHSELARDAEVAQAIADVLVSGKTRRLQTKWSNRSRAEACISDRELRGTHTQKVDWVHMEADARQHFLRNLNEPPQLTLRVPVVKNKKKTARRTK